MSMTQIDENKIAEAAFFLWLEEGQPVGRAEAHWEQAKTQLQDAISPTKPRRATRAKAGTATAKPKTATAARAKAPAKRKAPARKTAAAKSTAAE